VPRLTEFSSENEWVEPDDVPRPVVTYGIASGGFGDFELEPHHHAKSQILLVQRGALSCEVEGGLWIVPPGSALWIPGRARHSIKVTGSLEGYGAFVARDAEPGLPTTCRTVAVTPLLRELLVRAADLPLLYDEFGPAARMTAVLLDEISAARVEGLHLPMPTDPRLRKLADAMMATPDDRASLDVWALKANMSKRSLGRLMNQETGMSFGRWRKQLSVVLAVQWLADGTPMQHVAADLGYESVPSFVTMFRKVLGTSPARYMAERHAAPIRRIADRR
jgi:AraC-like DNA-binding protein